MMVGACVTWQVVALHGVRKSYGLAEREVQTFADDGVHAAGSIADEGDISRMDGTKRVHLRDCAPLSADEFRSGQPLRQLRRILHQRPKITIFRALGHDYDADFFASDRCYIRLGMTAPINFNVIGPGADAIVAARGISLRLPRRRIQTAPAADARTAAVCANDPARGNKFAEQLDSGFRDSGDGGAPEKFDAACFGTGDQPLMQNRSPDSNSRTLRKICGDLSVGLQEPDAANRVTRARRNLHAKFAERRNCFGHQAFTASFINRRFRAVCDRDGHSALTCRDCSCQPRGAASHHKHIQLCSA